MTEKQTTGYRKLLEIDRLDLSRKQVLLIGGGWMAGEYYNALRALGVGDISVITRTEDTASRRRDEWGVEVFPGGYREVLPKLSDGFDLVIISTPISALYDATLAFLDWGAKNILVEKPLVLYSNELKKLNKLIGVDVRVRVAYNRMTYPSYWRLKELIAERGEKITSCRYTFTEWIHEINFEKDDAQCYRRWGVSNSGHVISMAHGLIGLPESLNAERAGYLNWHPEGSRFVGSGLSKEGVLFSYHADWESAGRWGIEVMTDSNAYRLIPMEKLFTCSKGSVNWDEVEFSCAFANCKAGVAEEVAVMLEPGLEDYIELVTVERAGSFTNLTEKILGYRSCREEA